MQRIDHLTRQQQLDILTKAPFFRRFSEDERKILLNHGPELLAFTEEEWLIEQGDDSDHSLYVLLNGVLTVWANDQPVAELHKGQCVGEISFLSGTPRTGSVQCKTKAVVFRLEREHMIRLPITSREKIKDNLIALLMSRLDQGQGSGGSTAAPDGEDLLS